MVLEEEEAPRPRRPKKRSNQEDDEEVDFETRRWRPQFVDDAEREYMQFYAKDAPNMSSKRLHVSWNDVQTYLLAMLTID